MIDQAYLDWAEIVLDRHGLRPQKTYKPTTRETMDRATMRPYNEGNGFRTNDASLDDIGK
ncbi:MAG: hypothetical protein AAGL99_18360 [Pseudomonadota bacterium]